MITRSGCNATWLRHCIVILLYRQVRHLNYEYYEKTANGIRIIDSTRKLSRKTRFDI